MGERPEIIKPAKRSANGNDGDNASSTNMTGEVYARATAFKNKTGEVNARGSAPPNMTREVNARGSATTNTNREVYERATAFKKNKTGDKTGEVNARGAASGRTELINTEDKRDLQKLIAANQQLGRNGKPRIESVPVSIVDPTRNDNDNNFGATRSILIHSATTDRATRISFNAQGKVMGIAYVDKDNKEVTKSGDYDNRFMKDAKGQWTRRNNKTDQWHVLKDQGLDFSTKDCSLTIEHSKDHLTTYHLLDGSKSEKDRNKLIVPANAKRDTSNDERQKRVNLAGGYQAIVHDTNKKRMGVDIEDKDGKLLTSIRRGGQEEIFEPIKGILKNKHGEQLTSIRSVGPEEILETTKSGTTKWVCQRDRKQWNSYTKNENGQWMAGDEKDEKTVRYALSFNENGMSWTDEAGDMHQQRPDGTEKIHYRSDGTYAVKGADGKFIQSGDLKFAQDGGKTLASRVIHGQPDKPIGEGKLLADGRFEHTDDNVGNRLVENRDGSTSTYKAFEGLFLLTQVKLSGPSEATRDIEYGEHPDPAAPTRITDTWIIQPKSHPGGRPASHPGSRVTRTFKLEPPVDGGSNLFAASPSYRVTATITSEGPHLPKQEWADTSELDPPKLCLFKLNQSSGDIEGNLKGSAPRVQELASSQNYRSRVDSEIPEAPVRVSCRASAIANGEEESVKIVDKTVRFHEAQDAYREAYKKIEWEVLKALPEKDRPKTPSEKDDFGFGIAYALCRHTSPQIFKQPGSVDWKDPNNYKKYSVLARTDRLGAANVLEAAAAYLKAERAKEMLAVQLSNVRPVVK